MFAFNEIRLRLFYAKNFDLFHAEFLLQEELEKKNGGYKAISTIDKKAR
jgi:hypothetical protein